MQRRMSTSATMRRRPAMATVPGESDPIGDFLRANASFILPLNEESGPALDEGPNELSLTDNNEVGSGEGKVYPLARDFVGASNQSFSRASSAPLQFGEYDQSGALWVYNQVSEFGAGVILAKWDAVSEIRLLMLLGNLQLDFGGAERCSVPLSQNEWHHVAWVYKHATTTIELYVNNELVDSDSSTVAATAGNDDLLVGQWFSGSYFTGRLNQFYKGNFAFTQAHRNYLWNGGAGRAL